MFAIFRGKYGFTRNFAIIYGFRDLSRILPNCAILRGKRQIALTAINTGLCKARVSKAKILKICRTFIWYPSPVSGWLITYYIIYIDFGKHYYQIKQRIKLKVIIKVIKLSCVTNYITYNNYCKTSTRRAKLKLFSKSRTNWCTH